MPGRRAARRWLADRDAVSLNFLYVDARHLVGVQPVKKVAHYFVSDPDRWKYQIDVHLFELTYRRLFKTWTSDVWLVSHAATLQHEKKVHTNLELFRTEELFDSGKAALDRYAERRHVSLRLFKRGVFYTTEEPTP